MPVPLQKASRTILSDHRRLILINSVLGFQNFIGPVLVVFYTAYMGLTLQQFFFIDGLLFFLIALFELPSGYVADKLGRKRMLLISRLVTIFAMGVLLVINNFIGALISTILTGIFAAMESGNAEAIYYESFSKDHRETDLEKAYSIGGSVSFISLVLCSSLAGFLANIDLRIPVILDIALLSASLYFIIVYLHDDRSSYPTPQKISIVKLAETKRAIWNVTPIFLLSGLFFMLIRVSYSFYQPVMEHIGLNLRYFGLVFAAFNIIGAITSKLYAHYAHKIVNKHRVLVVFLLLFALSYIGIYATPTVFVLYFMALQQIVRAIDMPLFSIWKNDYIPKNTPLRVTYLSYSSLLSKLLVSFFLMLASALTSSLVITRAVLYFGVIALVIVAAATLWFTRLQKQGKITNYRQ